MAWAKVDDNLAFHPKVMAAGNEAMGVWVRTLSWAMQQLTDGFVPKEIVIAVKGSKVSRDLVAHGLWHEVDGGFQFNDWCQYQPTREKVLSEREKTAERVTKWRNKSSDSNAVGNAVTNDVSNAVSTPSPTRPDPLTTSKEVVRGATRIPSTFEITNAMSDWFTSKNLTLDINTETEKFVNYFEALDGPKAKKLDWVKTWMNWMLRAQSFLPASAAVDPWAGKEHLGFAE